MSLADQTLQFFPISARVSVLRARGLRIKGKDGTNDAYTTLQAGRESFRTAVAEKLAEPVWGGSDAAFIFTLPAESARGEPDGVPLQVRVFHRVPLGADKLLGLAVINVYELRQDSARENPRWFKLLNKAGKADKERGEVLLDVQFLKSSMSVSMIDLSEKSHSRLGKIKDKLRGKKKDGLSDSASAVLPSVLTDSEGEMDGEATEGEATKKKKNKLKSLFVPKSNMKRNSLSQSLSSLRSLPDKNSSVSSSTSSGLNVEPSEGKKKKKFPFLTHKRNGSTDSRTSNQSDFSLGSANQNTPPQIDICINGSHVYREETQSEKMQDMEEEEEEEEEKWRREEEELGEQLEEEKRREAEEERRRKEKEEQRRREDEEKESIRREREMEERRRRIEEENRDRVRMEKEREALRRRMEEEEKERVRVEKEKEEEKRAMEKEEKDRVRMAIEREEQRRRKEEEQERMRVEREMEEERERMEEEEKERIRMKREKEEQRRWLEEEEKERVRMDRELNEKRNRMEKEEKERVRMEREKEAERRRVEEEERERLRIEKEAQMRKLEEDERMKIKSEKEGQIKRLEEERKRKEEKEAEALRIKTDEEKNMRIAEEERKKRAERERMMAEEEKLKEEKRIEMERKLAREEEERRIASEKEKRRKEEDERVREENERKRAEMERKKKEEEQERRNSEMEERKKREEQERLKKKEENIFEESVFSQSSDFTRSARISNIKPSVPKPSVANTNPFLDTDFNANVSENLISVEQRTAKKGSPQFVGPDGCFAEVSEHLSHSKEVAKRQAPQPPGRLKTSGEVRDKGGINRAGLDQEGHQDDKQIDTNPFTWDKPAAEKRNKRPAPKPGGGISVSEGRPTSDGDDKIVTEGGLHLEEKASASNSKDKTLNWKLFGEPNDVTVPDQLARREEHLENTSKPGVDRDACSEPLVGRTDGLLKKSQAPLPPNKPKRSGDSSTLHQQPSIPNKTNSDSYYNQKDRDNASVSSSTFKPPADKSQFVNRCATETGETGSGSESRTLPWAKLVSDDAGDVRKQVAPTSVIRQHAVKPLSAAEKQPETSESRVADGAQSRTKAVEAVMKGPYSQLTHSELNSLALRQQEQISQRDSRIQELERYIDNLLVRVMEEKPSILMSLDMKNKSI